MNLGMHYITVTLKFVFRISNVIVLVTQHRAEEESPNSRNQPLLALELQQSSIGLHRLVFVV